MPPSRHIRNISQKNCIVVQLMTVLGTLCVFFLAADNSKATDEDSPPTHIVSGESYKAVAFSFAASDDAQEIEATHKEYLSRFPSGSRVGRTVRIVPDLQSILGERDRSKISSQSGIDRLSNLLEFRPFPNELYFLHNKSINMITPDVIGWRGDVLDIRGEIVGAALLQILSDDSVVGSIDVVKASSFKVLPVSKDGIHEIVEVLPKY